MSASGLSVSSPELSQGRRADKLALACRGDDRIQRSASHNLQLCVGLDCAAAALVTDRCVKDFLRRLNAPILSNGAPETTTICVPNKRQVARGREVVVCCPMRTGHILPCRQRGFIHELLDTTPRRDVLVYDHACQDFNIENPPTCEWLLKQRSRRGANAEEFGAALGVVHRKREDPRRHRGKDAPCVVSQGRTDDSPAKQLYAGPHNEAKCNVLVEDASERRDVPQRGGEIRVPVADVAHVWITESLQHSLAYGFGFADVLLERNAS